MKWGNTNTVHKVTVVLTVILAILLIPIFAAADTFTAKTLDDYGNVTVMEVTGNYDADNPDGTVNSDPRAAIAREFYRLHKDEYDFLVVFSNFDFKMPSGETNAFYLHVKNDIQGIGQLIYDNSAQFGSNGKLQGTIDMGNIANLVSDPIDPQFEGTLRLLGHEMMHRWGSYVRFKDSSGNLSYALLSDDKNHWSYLLDTKGSLLYGNQWNDNGDGTFTSVAAGRYYSPLDLYLMGMLDKSQAPPMLLIDNSSIDPSKSPEVGATISGAALSVSIDDIIAAEGQRVPDVSQSQKSFKTAFIFITSPGTYTGSELQGLENIRNGWITRFSVLTDGQGIMQVAPTTVENVAVNPGPASPPVTPRTLPPDINDGVSWLIASQKADGSWKDMSQTTDRDTAEVVFTLKNFPAAAQNYTLGSQWLDSEDSMNTDYLSRKIKALANAGQDLSGLIGVLVAGQNSDGGWGSGSGYMSSAEDTAFALAALSAAGYSDETVISPAIAYLQAKHNADGGWGGDDGGSTVAVTADALNALGAYRSAYQLETQIANGVSWLAQKQNSDGGFGNSPSTVYNTAIAVSTLTGFNVSADITNNGLNYIRSRQSGSGSWNESPYQTALAINAIWKASVEPDLSVKAEDITFTPSSVSILPANIVMNVSMWNLGMTAVAQADVSLYDGSVSDANRIGQQTVSFLAQSSVTITFPLTITDGNEHTYYVVVDPDNLIQESNKANNTAARVLSPQGTYDFQVLSSDISASPNPVDIFQDVTITSKVSNLGTLDAYNVQIRYYIDDPGGPIDIATSTVDIPAGGSVTNQVTWHTNRAGENLPLTVEADPFNKFTEASKDNNKAAIPLTVTGSTEPNLTVSYQDITINPNPVNQGGDAAVSVIVKNQGFSTATNVLVNFYEGTPGVDGVLLGSQTITSLDAGNSAAVSLNWTNIADSGEKIIYVQVDPDNLIQEITKDDNSAFTTLSILSLPDLAITSGGIQFSPAAPKDGDTVTITATVQNLGDQGVSDVTVTAYEGGAAIGAQVIPAVASHSLASTKFTYDTTGKSGAHQITVVVDPDNSIMEQTRSNNTASATFGVQNANMWLTESYISPNGDGVQDSTIFFFNLDATQTVNVIISGKNGTVRTFNGSELVNIAGGNITWDGLDEKGQVVADGQYQIRVVDANNNDLGGLMVVVDNNRSPFSDAIGTKFLLNANVSCTIPDFNDWKWLADDIGILFNITRPNSNTPEYPTGLYTMAPDGSGVSRIIPQTWCQGADPRYDYFIDGYDVSPDGEKVAFILDKRDKYSWNVLVLNQVWIVNRDGTDLTLLDSRDMTQPSVLSINKLQWSPTGSYIFYGDGYPEELWIMNPDGTGRMRIDSNVSLGDSHWSPDGSQIAYLVYSYDTRGNTIATVRVNDISGNKRDLFSTTDYTSSLMWFGNSAVIIESRFPGTTYYSYSLWFVDASGAGNNKELSQSQSPQEVSIAPNGKSVAFTSSDSSSITLTVSGGNGNSSVLYALTAANSGCKLELDNLVWSPDSSKVAFLESASQDHIAYSSTKAFSQNASSRIATMPQCTAISGPFLSIINVATKEKTSVPADSSWTLSKWMSDGISIAGAYHDAVYYYHVAAINSQTGGTGAISSNRSASAPDDPAQFVSPVENYIAYYSPVDSSSVCYGKGYTDLWTASSLLNLTASLRAEIKESAVVLKGIAADLNFKQYLLEYADVNSPDSWNPIGLPSDVPVLNDVFTTWVPPYEGTFYVRLTVSDLAGNVARDTQRIVWGQSSSITNLYTDYDIFSPNGDGVKDTVTLYYNVVGPTHLEFDIYDQNNNLVSSIPKDYSAATNDSITWDGRDSNGNVAPDGKYDIRVLDFDFFVEVDNTPPDVGLSLSALKQRATLLPIPVASIVADLNGRAFDENLRNWVVEYGEGDNPQNWYKLKEGSDVLIGTDSSGVPMLDPPMDVNIQEYQESEIEFLVGKKFKITATDSAGNVSSTVTDFLEEKVIVDKVLNSYDVVIPILLSEPDKTYSDLAFPGRHSLSGVETIRGVLSSATVQYWSDDRQWHDAVPAANPPSGVLNLTWDNTLSGPAAAVRFKAVDVPGQAHYSNAVLTDQMFSVSLDCSALLHPLVTGFNDLFEDLSMLTFQVIGEGVGGPQYFDWTDYKVFDSSRGEIVPEGHFDFPFPTNLPISENYYFRMIGRGVSGKKYESNYIAVMCPSGAPKLDLFGLLPPTYREMGCGQVSGQATISAMYFIMPGWGGGVSMRSLSYYIQTSEGLQLLKQIDLTKEPWGGVTVDTRSMPEGSYPVKAVFDYIDLDTNELEELTDSKTLIVDHGLPVAKITYPGNSLAVCPITGVDVKGSWPAMQIEGVASDNTQVKNYALYYGYGTSPAVWVPASTRISGKDVPMTGNGPVQGQLGLWDLTGLSGQNLSVMLKVVDVTGNTSCDTVTFSVNLAPEIASLTSDKDVFSPNGDGSFDTVNVNYAIDENGAVDIKVFPLTENADGSYSLGQTPVRTIAYGLQYLGGTATASWDGKDDAGTAVSDGTYGIAVSVTGSCSNTAMKWTKVEVDDTPPAAEMDSPKSNDQLGNIVQVTGTADDLHFESYLLEAGQGANPDSWVQISTGSAPIQTNLLGAWNTFGLSGTWTLRLTTKDTVANTTVASVSLDLGQRQTLIKELSAAPVIFSPNGDGALDTTSITYSLTDSCQTELDLIDSSGLVRRINASDASAAGSYSFVWDGTDNAAVHVPDGAYTVRLHAALLSNPSVAEDESITAVVDTAPPAVSLPQLLNGSYFQGDVVVNGTINDTNLQGYSINYTGGSGATLLNQGSQNRTNYSFGTIAGLAEGSYVLNVTASDVAGNETQNAISFTIDKTPPAVTIGTPKEGDVYGSNNGAVSITGSIVEANLDSFSLRYGSGDNPSQWTELLSGNAMPTTGQLASLNVGKGSAVADGLYTVSLYAKDKAGLTGEAKVKITVDNTPPVVAITLPRDGGYVKGPSDITGTASDANLSQYAVELSQGRCAGAFKWTTIKTTAAPVTNGTLASLQVLPSDGNYCLRLTATDKAGNTSATTSGFIIDTQPPAAPVLSGTIRNRTDAALTWTQNTEPDLAGYNVYRDAQKINTTVISAAAYSDQGLKEGSYNYTVTALDFAGNESVQSNQVTLKVDITPPSASITVPKDGSRVGGVVNIMGTAYSSNDFKQYRVFIGQGSSPATWTLIRTSPVPIPYGLLAQWDTTTLPETAYSIKLEAEDLSGNVNTRQVTVTIDNAPPAPPVLLSAVPNNSDVTLTWQANSEPDLAGYLLYRNDQLANVSGIVMGDLTPYLIVGTTYVDKSVPDGKFTYYLVAVDQAGNQSGPSNSLQVTLDTHPPHATISSPADGTKFQGKTTVAATTSDLDISTIQFQYKRAQDTTWTDMGSPVTQAPYVTFLDPAALGLTYGDYNLRAVATDQGGKTDPAPDFITVTYADVTPPAAPINLRAKANGSTVTLTWSPNTEADLKGYNIYRALPGGAMSAINTSAVSAATYQDTGLQDWTYTYQVTAVDTFGNESGPSNNASVNIYAPVITQPYTPTSQSALEIDGSNAAAGSLVEIFTDSGSGPVSQGKTPADSSGNFVFNTSLSIGENRLTATATDSAGNISRSSALVVVVYDLPPAAPTGLASSGDGHDVGLTWNPNIESNLSGYNIFRNGTKLNTPSAVTNATAKASTGFTSPSKAIDSDQTTYASAYDNDPANPAWIEIDLPSAALINHMDIRWGTETDAQGNTIMYAGKDYEVQVWSGYAWITQEQVTGNGTADNAFDFAPSYRTDKIRIYITDTTDPDGSSKQVMIAEVGLVKDNLVSDVSFTDTNVPNGTDSYQVTAVDYYGFESPPSAASQALVDAPTPAAPQNLVATASGSNIDLTWDPNAETDLAGYNVYRNTSQGWTLLNSSPTTDTYYSDMNLPNGTYTYRVAAVDAAGNESGYSNEATAAVLTTAPPAPPVLFYPTVAGIPFINYSGRTDVAGIAAPGLSVQLFENGSAAGTTTALGSDTFQSYSIDSDIWDASISPDGKTLAYSNNVSLLLKDLQSGNETAIVSKGYNPLWSPQGNKLIYMSNDYSWKSRISVYDRATGVSALLTDDSGVNEDYPAWTTDESAVYFVTNRGGSPDAWSVDLGSGTITQITSGGLNPAYLSVSPDNSKLSYFINESLYVVDLTSNATTLIDDNTDGRTSNWSPGSDKLLFVSYKNGFGDIYTYDQNTQLQTQATNVSTNDLYYAMWSPDGSQIVFDKWDNLTQTDSLEVVPGNGQEQPRLIKGNLSVSYLSKTNPGQVVYIDQNTFDEGYLQGSFSFTNLQLLPGENFFYATAADSAGKVSEPSEDIEVVFDGAKLPDLEIEASDIVIFPSYPMVGQTAAATVTAHNAGQGYATNVAVDIYLQDPTGNLTLVQSETIASMPAGSDASFSVAVDTTGKAGTNMIMAVIDPQDEIQELTETNNVAEESFFVGTQAGVVMTTTLDKEQYTGSRNAQVTVDLKNNGSEEDGTLKTKVEDEKGQTVAVIDTRSIKLPYGADQNYALTWNTGATIAGSYSVHTIFKDTGGNVISENTVPFTILPDMNVSSSVVTDKAAYGADANVTITGGVTNNGQNYTLSSLDVMVSIIDFSGSVVFTETGSLLNLMPGATGSLNWTWNTGLSPAGSYSIVMSVNNNGQVVSSKSTTFSINASPIITGSLAVSPKVVAAFRSAQAGYTINNAGNAPLSGLTVNVVVTDPDTQTVMTSRSDTADLGMNVSKSGAFTFSTKGYALKTYAVALQYVYQGMVRTAATASFSVQDETPPVVGISSPASGNNYDSHVPVAVVATDDASGISNVEYQMDGGPWNRLALSDQASGKYSTLWVPSAAGQGTHVINARATDNAGNTSAVSSVTFSVTVVAPPPAGTIAINDNDTYTNNAGVTLTLQAADSNGNAPAKMCLSNISSCSSWVSYAPTETWALSPGDGLKTVYVRYQDGPGNTDSSPYSASITLDTTPPASVITSPSTGTVMAETLLISGTASDVGSGVDKVDVSTDGGSTWGSASGTASWTYQLGIQADGSYTIKSRVTDKAGNVEIPGPGVSVTAYKREPDDVSINGRQLMVNGNAFTVKGVVYSPVPIGQDPEAGPPYGDYFTQDYDNIYTRDLPLLRRMGANVVRILSWDPAADHHDFLDNAYNGGVNPIRVIAGYWIDPGLDIDPQSPDNVREKIKADFRKMVAAHKNHPAILMWAVGNDLNADAMYGANKDDLFSLINEMAAAAHEEEGSNYHPVTTALADSSLIPTITAYDAYAPSLDVWGANIYRGNSFGTLFGDFRAASSKPLSILGYGIDAFDNVNGDEYENIGAPYQATFAKSLWNEITENSDVCIGGSIMEYSDEWWKGKDFAGPACADNDPAFHGACGAPAGYSPDSYDNVEWWGIMRSRANAPGPDTMEPRVLYYTLQELWSCLANAPAISVNPASASFGTVAVGDQPVIQSFTISNAGSDNLVLDTITLSGLDAQEFAKQNDGCSGRTLVPSGVCSVSVSFSPLTAGSKNAVLSIASSDAANPSLSVGLTGIATSSISGAATSCVFGADGVTMSGGSYVDSYDSTKGAYNGTHGAKGDVGTNSTVKGVMTLSGGAIIYGDALVGPGGDPSKVITLNGGAVIYGSRSSLNAVKDMTPKTDPGGGTQTTFTNGTTLGSGVYRVGSISLSGKATATINGNVTMYVPGGVSVSGNAKIVITAGSSLTLYAGGNISISGGGIVNQGQDPHAFSAYGTSGCASASYSGGSAFYGSIYAPKANTAISGNSTIYGSVIGKTVKLSGGAVVHCDESL